MSNTIPKIIHYCWFGGNKEPELMKKCINTWKKYLPDYEIIEWNEQNFDVNSNKYVKEAYNEKKWAFVSDYVRLYALYNYGGIYLDTDVEILKSLDKFLMNGAFSGFEEDGYITTGILAAKRENKWIKKLLLDYKERSFYNQDGSLDLTTNVKTITKISKKLGFNDEKHKNQVFDEDVHIYTQDYFAAKSYKTGEITITDNTHAIHHFAGSWVKKDFKYWVKKCLFSCFGESNIKKIVKIIKSK